VSSGEEEAKLPPTFGLHRPTTGLHRPTLPPDDDGRGWLLLLLPWRYPSSTSKSKLPLLLLLLPPPSEDEANDLADKSEACLGTCCARKPPPAPAPAPEPFRELTEAPEWGETPLCCWKVVVVDGETPLCWWNVVAIVGDTPRFCWKLVVVDGVGDEKPLWKFVGLGLLFCCAALTCCLSIWSFWACWSSLKIVGFGGCLAEAAVIAGDAPLVPPLPPLPTQKSPDRTLPTRFLALAWWCWCW
jgi:hypothetical protein